MSTTSPARLALSPLMGLPRVGLVASLVAGLALFAGPVHATPWAVPSSAALAAGPEAAGPSDATTVDGALEAGDLTTAKALAREAREAEPTAATWQREGEVLEHAGDYGDAAKAYRGAKAAAGEDAAAATAAEQGLIRVKALARGTVHDEPASTHREELDPRWEPPPPKPEPVPEPEPEPPAATPDRIVTKWYFWVTVGAIAASAVAVASIAIKAARDDQPDALDAFTAAPASRGMGALRF